MTTGINTSTPLRRWCTCLFIAMVIVGVPLAAAWPEHAMSAMRLAGLGAGSLLAGAFLNGRVARRGLVAGMFLVLASMVAGYALQRGAYMNPFDEATAASLRAARSPVWRVAEQYFPDHSHFVTVFVLVAGVSVVLFVVRQRFESRSERGGGKWAGLLASLDFPRKRR